MGSDGERGAEEEGELSGMAWHLLKKRGKIDFSRVIGCK